MLLRFDTEDFLTPESDDAALWIATMLKGRGIQATFPVTAWKVAALQRRRRQDVIDAMGVHAPGFHSTSHSLHPTIAEELLATPDDEAADAFQRRESDGLAQVEAAFGRSLACYTQPGANWVAEASPVLARWGIPLHYGEGWNAYVDACGRPFRLGGVLHYSGPVACPKPFFSALPACLEAALAEAGRAVTKEREDIGEVGLVNIVAHPTELVTTTFWDALNFGGGTNAPKANWAPPPLRPVDDTTQARVAFEAYIDRLRSLPGVSFWSATDLVRAFPDLVSTLTFTLDDARQVAGRFANGAVGSVYVRGAALSPAQAVTLIARALTALGVASGVGPLAVPQRLPSFGAEPPEGRGTVATASLREAADRIGRLAEFPSDVGGVPPAAGAGALARLLLAYLADGAWPESVALPQGRLLTRRFVRSERDLHWDWPVFAPGFQAPQLRERALRAAWTLSPLERTLCDYALT